MSKKKANVLTTKKRAAAMLELFGSDGKHWAKDDMAYSRVRGGRSTKVDNWCDYEVMSKDERANSWCMLGAMRKLDIPQNGWLDLHLKAAAEELRSTGKNSVLTSTAGFNDEDGWKPVKALLSQLAEHGKIVNPKDLLS